VRELHDAGWDGASELLVLNPAGAFHGRNWPLDAYIQFARQWRERTSAPVRFTILGQRALTERAAYLRAHLGDAVIDLVGRTSAAAAFGIVQRARLVMSEDSGLMHLAWAAGTPTIGLFGASSATWSRPHGNYSDCIRACVRPDGTCIDGACRAGSPTCLEALTAGQVVQRADVLLRHTAGRRKVIDSGGRAFAPPVDS
jgi:ADP-heptose:LPS heptosyltransferase